MIKEYWGRAIFQPLSTRPLHRKRRLSISGDPQSLIYGPKKADRQSERHADNEWHCSRPAPNIKHPPAHRAVPQTWEKSRRITGQEKHIHCRSIANASPLQRAKRMREEPFPKTATEAQPSACAHGQLCTACRSQQQTSSSAEQVRSTFGCSVLGKEVHTSLAIFTAKSSATPQAPTVTHGIGGEAKAQRRQKQAVLLRSPL